MVAVVAAAAWSLSAGSGEEVCGVSVFDAGGSMLAR